mgnify:CR=1 FL=1
MLAAAAVLLSLARAPFLHVHVENLDPGHAGGVAHSHLRPYGPPDAVSITARTADDDAVELPWSVSASPSPPVLDLELPGEQALFEPRVGSWTVREVRLHGHDPPFHPPRLPRAPPA